ncbi:MAG: 50S ribosomal protein L17 [Kiritimatiellia bacterium]
MRHRKKTVKLGRKTEHRESMFANMVTSLIQHTRITTTIRKARAASVLAEKMVTLAKKGDLAARRLAISRIRSEDGVRDLFANIGPFFKDRQGGYTRVLKLGRRSSDSSEMAILEWVDYVKPAAAAAPAETAKS